MNLIDKEQTYKELSEYYHHTAFIQHLALSEALDRVPTVDAEPVRHGKWIKLDMHEHLADHKCTACGQECYVPTCMGEPMYTYCPNCGAKMDGEQEKQNE